MVNSIVCICLASSHSCIDPLFRCPDGQKLLAVRWRRFVIKMWIEQVPLHILYFSPASVYLQRIYPWNVENGMQENEMSCWFSGAVIIEKKNPYGFRKTKHSVVLFGWSVFVWISCSVSRCHFHLFVGIHR